MNPLKLQPSAFWIAVRRMLSWRFLGAVAILFCCLEATARLAPVVVGKKVHQPFLYSQELCRFECANQGRVLLWKANSRGARGSLYRGQPQRIAVFGSSTSADRLLDQEQTWAERLREKLGGATTHVDNYGLDGGNHHRVRTILKHLVQTGIHYDVAVLMVHFTNAKGQREHFEKTAFNYSTRWALNGRLLEGPTALRHQLLYQASKEPRLYTVINWLYNTLKKPVSPPGGIVPLSRSNRKLRNSGQVRFVDVDVSLTEEEEATIRREMRELLLVAEQVADRILFIVQPMAYDEQALPGVEKKWFSLYAAPGHDGAYISNYSIAMKNRRTGAVMAEEAERFGVAVFDLDSVLRPMLRERDDLFDDKWHFAPPGAAVAGRLVAMAIRDLEQEAEPRNADGRTAE